MVEVVVYLTDDYSINESIFVLEGLSKSDITKEVNRNFDRWFYYDIL